MQDFRTPVRCGVLKEGKMHMKFVVDVCVTFFMAVYIQRENEGEEEENPHIHKSR